MIADYTALVNDAENVDDSARAMYEIAVTYGITSDRAEGYVRDRDRSINWLNKSFQVASKGTKLHTKCAIALVRNLWDRGQVKDISNAREVIRELLVAGDSDSEPQIEATVVVQYLKEKNFSRAESRTTDFLDRIDVAPMQKAIVARSLVEAWPNSSDSHEKKKQWLHAFGEKYSDVPLLEPAVTQAVNRVELMSKIPGRTGRSRTLFVCANIVLVLVLVGTYVFRRLKTTDTVV